MCLLHVTSLPIPIALINSFAGGSGGGSNVADSVPSVVSVTPMGIYSLLLASLTSMIITSPVPSVSDSQSSSSSVSSSFFAPQLPVDYPLTSPLYLSSSFLAYLSHLFRSLTKTANTDSNDSKFSTSRNLPVLVLIRKYNINPSAFIDTHTGSSNPYSLPSLLLSSLHVLESTGILNLAYRLRSFPVAVASCSLIDGMLRMVERISVGNTSAKYIHVSSPIDKKLIFHSTSLTGLSYALAGLCDRYLRHKWISLNNDTVDGIDAKCGFETNSFFSSLFDTSSPLEISQVAMMASNRHTSQSLPLLS
jgi:hypothetical protein